MEPSACDSSELKLDIKIHSPMFGVKCLHLHNSHSIQAYIFQGRVLTVHQVAGEP